MGIIKRKLDKRGYVKKYAKIIIKKFGEETALKYANSRHSCPCAMQEIKCSRCKHEDKDKESYRHTSRYTGCVEAESFIPMMSDEVKRKIKGAIG